jgi:Lipopolysaccharide export system permease LptF/LptG
MSRPGDRLRAFAARLVGPEAMTRVIDPVITDLQHEYRQALEQNRTWRAAWVRLAGYATFAKVLMLCEWSEEEIGSLMRAALYSVAATVPFTAVFMYAPVTFVVTRANLPDPWRVGMSLIPQALAAAIPPGTALGVTIALAGRQVSRRLAIDVGAMALICSFVSLINIAWVVPEANQWFRAATFAAVAPGRPAPPRGENELTVAALSRAINQELKRDWPIGSGQSMNLRRLQFAYWNRFAFAFATLALVSVAVSLVTIARRRWALLLIVFLAACGWYALAYVGRETVLHSNVPVIVAAWLPNVVLVSMAGGVMRIRSRAGHSRRWS